jgi:uncharacterized protein YjbJ (UPF0337 family)
MARIRTEIDGLADYRLTNLGEIIEFFCGFAKRTRPLIRSSVWYTVSAGERREPLRFKHQTKGVTVEGMRDKVEGKLKETEGKLTDDELREKQGEAQQKVGEGKEQLEDAKDEARDRI